jgi:hypothetical protein
VLNRETDWNVVVTKRENLYNIHENALGSEAEYRQVPNEVVSKSGLAHAFSAVL